MLQCASSPVGTGRQRGLPNQGQDPRAGIVPTSALECEEHLAQGTSGLLVHHTRTSGLRIGAAMDHHIEGPAGTAVESESSPNVARVTVTAASSRASGCGSSSSLPTVGQASIAAGDPRPGDRRTLRRTADRLGGSTGRAACLPGQILGECRCRTGGRPTDPAGGALRAFPRPASGIAWRAEANPSERADGAWL